MTSKIPSSDSEASPSPDEMGKKIAKEHAYLMKIAYLQLRNAEQAEDVVQEVMLSALAQAQQFREDSKVRTWLVAILRNKLVDIFRQNAKMSTISVDDDEFDADAFDVLFLENNQHWATSLREWPSPEETLSDKQFWQILSACLSVLPALTGKVFVQREIFGDDIDELCTNFNLTASNVSVMLYRARMSLRECLERKWLR